MLQPRLGDCKHVEVVGGNGVLYLVNKVFSILERAYTQVCDFDVVVRAAQANAFKWACPDLGLLQRRVLAQRPGKSIELNCYTGRRLGAEDRLTLAMTVIFVEFRHLVVEKYTKSKFENPSFRMWFESGRCTEDSGVILEAVPPWVKL